MRVEGLAVRTSVLISVRITVLVVVLISVLRTVRIAIQRQLVNKCHEPPSILPKDKCDCQRHWQSHRGVPNP